MREIRAAVGIRGSVVRRNKRLTILCPHIWIIQWVYVYGAAIRMVGQFRFSRYSTVIEAGRVIVRH